MLAFALALFLSVPVQKEQSPATKAWSVLRDGLSDSHSDKRSKAVQSLQIIKHDHEAEVLAEKALVDTAAEVRAEAAAVLGKQQARTALPKLRAALNDPEVKVVLSATEALYNLHDPAAYDVYYAILTGQRKSSQSLVQSQMAILKNPHQLEKLAFETGIGFVPFGSMGYEAWKTITHNGSAPVKAQAAERLAKDPDPKTKQALVDALFADNWQVRAAAATALANRGDAGMSKDLLPALDDTNDTVRYHVAAAIIELSTLKRRVSAHR
jgi:HEAT repeat protein